MEKVRYMISDAANIVNVESHVLRYWEDELELNVPRNELGVPEDQGIKRTGISVESDPYDRT